MWATSVRVRLDLIAAEVPVLRAVTALLAARDRPHRAPGPLTRLPDLAEVENDLHDEVELDKDDKGGLNSLTTLQNSFISLSFEYLTTTTQ